MAHYVYILGGPGKRYYVGSTSNLETRFARHIKGHAAAYTQEYGFFEILYSEAFETQIAAYRRERQLKGWRRAKKAALIAGDIELLKSLK